MGLARGPVTVGVDLAAKQDFTAIAASVSSEEEPEAFEVPFLARLPHGLTYRQIAQAVANAVRRIPTEEEIRLIADATGGYAAVVEMIAEELRNDPVRILAATFTNGDHLDWSVSHAVTVGKACMVRRLQILLQDERLHLPPGPLAVQTKDELRHYEIKPTDAGNEQYGAFKTGKHDDLVTAVGLATLGDPSAREIPLAVSRTWLPGWERGIMTSEEEAAWSEEQKAGRRKHVDGVARSLAWLTRIQHGR